MAGEVVAVNDDVTDRAGKVNEDAVRRMAVPLKPADPDALAAMLDAAAYEKLIG